MKKNQLIEGLERTITGTVNIEGEAYVYFCENEYDSPSEQFYKLTGFVNPPHVKGGGVQTTNCRLVLPDNSIFHAITYRGDIEGWRRQIEEGAAGLNVVLAMIEDDKLVVSDGRVYDLCDCIPKFS